MIVSPAWEVIIKTKTTKKKKKRYISKHLELFERNRELKIYVETHENNVQRSELSHGQLALGSPA